MGAVVSRLLRPTLRMASVTGPYHVKARCEIYPRSNQKRFQVPNEFVPWEVNFDGYQPVTYTSKTVLDRPPWADPDPPGQFRWNEVDSVTDQTGQVRNVSRKSYEKTYVVKNNYPRNPRGRTGLQGRGCLGRWGPNHAADPIVTRWKLDGQGKSVLGVDGKPVAQFIAVQRRDNNEWAIPGGMVDPDEVITDTLRREFGEEALNSLQASKEEKQRIAVAVDQLFKNGQVVYRGYVDDPRNTDNAWMETVAMKFHDGGGRGVAQFQLHAGDDAVGVQWLDLHHDMDLYASHKDLLQKTSEILGASW